VRWNRRGLIGVAISIAALTWVLRQVDFAGLAGVLRQSSAAWWALSVVTTTSIFPLRAIRWRYILDPIAPRLPVGMLWRATAVGMMVNNLIPLRAGEVARAYALTRETPRVGLAASFTSLAVDRVFDAVVLILLLAIGMIDLPTSDRVIQGRALEDWVLGGTIVLGLAVAALYLVVVFPDRIIRLYEAFARRVAPSVEERGRRLLRTFADGLSVLRSPGRFALVLAWTIVHWLVAAAGFWFGFRAVGLEASFSAAMVIQGLIAMGVAAPSSPGFWGVFEAIAVLALTTLYGVASAEAAAWAIGFHFLSFIPITLIGLYYFGRLDMSFGDIGRVRQTPARGVPAAADSLPAGPKSGVGDEPTRAGDGHPTKRPAP
jgi:uncharacterized protein (TIRG00374 family)